MSDVINQIAKDEFILSAISGVSKEQMVRFFKEEYEYTDKDMDELIQSCNFNKKPRFINYRKFYNLKIPSTAIKSFKFLLLKFISRRTSSQQRNVRKS